MTGTALTAVESGHKKIRLIRLMMLESTGFVGGLQFIDKLFHRLAHPDQPNFDPRSVLDYLLYVRCELFSTDGIL